jgi:hypothetical protein
MMHGRLATLALVSACGSLALGGPWADASGPAARLTVGGSTAPAHSVTPTNTWHVTLSPAPDDLALAELSFRPRARGQSISRHTLALEATAPFGDDYMAAAAPISSAPSELRLLVMVVNRPSPLDDPVDVHVRLMARAALGAPVVWKLTDPFAHANGDPTPALCDLPLHGFSSLSGDELLPLRSQGAALPGLSAASAVAQAYDVACGLPYESSFQRDVISGMGSPTPPVPPGCMPCDPAPGYACPLVQPSICVAGAMGGARRSTAGAH